ncbi:LYAM3 protein, partial [Phaetusa simplex]|nr:LYAM3 protein [Phaetusa simplex]
EVGAWTYHYSDQGDYTWEQARNYCQTFFTDLVAIQNKQEIEYLNETLPFHGRYYWIGIRKLGGTWTWVGTRKALTKEAENWAAGEPNNRRSNQDCVEIYIKRQRESGKWNDEPCNRRKKALCYRASCQPFPCSQRGECVETIGSYRCECYPGFHGPECEDVVQCAKLEPKGVHMNCSHPYGDFSYNSTCVFGCQEGFERRGAGTLQCLASQQWSAETPTCTGRACQGLGLAGPERGQVDCSHPHGTFAFNSICAFSCQEGFKLTGVRRLQCMAGGVWTRPPFAVKAEPAGGYLSAGFWGPWQAPLGILQGTVLACKVAMKGKVYQGSVWCQSESRRCREWGLFHLIYLASGTCSPIAAITCPVLDAPDRGEVNCSHHHGDFAFGSTCAFSCQTGFALMGPESRQCTATGTWTGDAPHCEAITCPVLTAPDRGELNCSHLHGDFTFGSTCVFSCQTGFELTGRESHECTATGTWTGDAPRCKGRVAAQCTGFALMGPESRECTATGTWTGDAPRCEGSTAARAQGVIGLGVMLGCSLVSWSQQSSGFFLKYASLSAIKCSTLTTPKMGQAACSHLHGDFAFGSTCAFSCQTGFVLMGPESRKCTATGNWTGDAPRCKATSCPVLDPPSRGQLSCSHLHGNFTYNSTCTFSCEEGFVRMGAEVLRCTATGNWTRHPPICAG